MSQNLDAIKRGDRVCWAGYTPMGTVTKIKDGKAHVKWDGKTRVSAWYFPSELSKSCEDEPYLGFSTSTLEFTKTNQKGTEDADKDEGD